MALTNFVCQCFIFYIHMVFKQTRTNQFVRATRMELSQSFSVLMTFEVVLFYQCFQVLKRINCFIFIGISFIILFPTPLFNKTIEFFENSGEIIKTTCRLKLIVTSIFSL